MNPNDNLFIHIVTAEVVLLQLVSTLRLRICIHAPHVTFKAACRFRYRRHCRLHAVNIQVLV